jgi:hypothetical protein
LSGGAVYLLFQEDLKNNCMLISKYEIVAEKSPQKVKEMWSFSIFINIHKVFGNITILTKAVQYT